MSKTAAVSLGVNSQAGTFLRHLLAGGLSALLVFLVWQVHAAWSPDMRLWKAFGGASFTLLWLAVLIGPAAKLWRPFARLITWRREFGIWFTVIGLVHGYLVWDGWTRWDVWRLLGYEYVPELDAYLRFEPGFGLANLMGLVALTFGLALAATSFDRAVDFLGASAWKWLHSFSYVIFHLVALHGIYFAFIHYSPSPHRILMNLPVAYPANPLGLFYVGMLLSVVLAQAGAFIRTVHKRRKSRLDHE